MRRGTLSNRATFFFMLMGSGSDSLDPASATAVDLLQGAGLRVQDVSYRAGLVQTFSGPTTQNPPEVLGSPIPLGADTKNESSVYDQFDSIDPANALALSGNSNPPFMSAALSTPNPNAVPVSDSTFNSFHAMAKFGSVVAILLGLHPVEQEQATGAPAASAPTTQAGYVVSGTKLAILAIAGAAIIILLLNGRGE